MLLKCGKVAEYAFEHARCPRNRGGTNLMEEAVEADVVEWLEQIDTSFAPRPRYHAGQTSSRDG